MKMNWYEKSRLCGRYRSISEEEKLRIFSFRDNPTPAEKCFWNIVRNNQVEGMKFRRQHKIGQFIVDFYCHKVGLVVEIDGSVHDKKKTEDAVRTRFLESLGLRVVRFTNDEVLTSPEIVKEKLASFITPLAPQGGRTTLLTGAKTETAPIGGQGGHQQHQNVPPPGAGGVL